MENRPSALITGATRGIGRAIADELADTHHLILGGRKHGEVAELAASYPSAEPFVAELTDPDAVEKAAAGITSLDALIHSAGITRVAPIAELSHADWMNVLTTNVVAVADLTRLLLPALRTTRGQVILINSGSGFFTSPGNAAYASSKFALRAFADTLREEERPNRIRVTSVHPGRVDTDMQREIVAAKGDEYKAGEHLVPSSVAKAVSFALSASPEAQVESISVRPLIK